MNSLNKILNILVMVLILLISQTGYLTGTDPIPSSWPALDPTPLARGQQTSENGKNSSAEKIALSGAAQLFKHAKIVKNLDQYRKRLIRNFRFEYSKTFSNSGSALDETVPQTENAEKKLLKIVSFSGELDHNLSPVLEFNSRLNIIDVSSTFHLIYHEVECDISSRPVNDFLGGRAAMGFCSDGETTEALIRFRFDF
nr:hypothetical protein [uncultured Desulfobacter sp.]